MVEPRVTEALGKPIVGPLDPYFFEVADRTRELLRLVFGTRNETTLVIPGPSATRTRSRLRSGRASIAVTSTGPRP